MVNELVATLVRYTDAHPGENAIPTTMPGVRILRADRRRRPRPVGFKPALCFIAQGAKAYLLHGPRPRRVTRSAASSRAWTFGQRVAGCSGEDS
jgi:hypothetical protein